MHATATLNDVTFGGRVLPPVATACLLITTVTVAAAWMIAEYDPILTSAGDVSGRVSVSTGPAGAPDGTFEDRWARTTASAPSSVVPLVPQRPIAPDGTFEARWTRATASAPARVVLLVPQRLVERANNVPSPPQPVPPPASTSQERVTPLHNKSLPLPERRTAVYDIAARTVYLPNGDRLEAHSGLGDKLDDTRYVHVRMRGPTPPNVYQLTLREQPFHGIRAIRLNPVDDGKMFGRDGMLAHTYMLGPSGQSNGCVSFRDYQKFLNAYLRGEVDRLVVVANLGTKPSLTARERHGRNYRYASND